MFASKSKHFAVILSGLLLVMCTTTYASAAQRTNELTPDLVIVAETNILKPLVRLLIPKEIADKHAVIGTITDAIYCRPLHGNTALVLGQLTKSNRKEYAPSLVAEDCNIDIKSVAAKHDHDSGFSAAISFEVDWDTWQVKRTVRDFSPSPSEIFHEWELQAIKAHKSEISTVDLALDSGNIHEIYNLALQFLPNKIALGFFTKLISIGNIHWWDVGNIQQLSDPQINESIFIRHSVVSTLLAKYPDQVTYTLPTGDSLQNFIYSSQSSADKRAVVIRASVPYSGFKVEIETRWLGSPLTYAGSSAEPKPNSGAIAQIVAQRIRDACDASLKDQAILPKTENIFRLNFGSADSLKHFFFAKFSSANEEYLFFAGNGGVDLAH